MGRTLASRMKQPDVKGPRTPAEAKKEVKRQVYLAYQQGRTVGYSLQTIIESGASLKVIRAVFRG